MKPPPKYRPVATLGSVADTDCRWYYCSATAAMGFHGNDPGATGTTRHAADVGWLTNAQIRAATRYRRIHAAIERLSPMTAIVLQTYYEPRRRAGELESWFGPLVNLVFLMLQHGQWRERWTDEKVRPKDTRGPAEVWLERAVRSEKVQLPIEDSAGLVSVKPARDVVRAVAEAALERALAAYSAVRQAPTEDEQAQTDAADAAQKQTRRGRKSVAGVFDPPGYS